MLRTLVSFFACGNDHKETSSDFDFQTWSLPEIPSRDYSLWWPSDPSHVPMFEVKGQRQIGFVAYRSGGHSRAHKTGVSHGLPRHLHLWSTIGSPSYHESKKRAYERHSFGFTSSSFRAYLMDCAICAWVLKSVLLQSETTRYSWPSDGRPIGLSPTQETQAEREPLR